MTRPHILTKRRLSRFAAAAAAFGLVATACGTGDSAPQISGSPEATIAPVSAPPVAVPALPDIGLISFVDDSVTTLNAYVGKPLVVNFWAEWCPSCVAEMSAAFKPAQEQLGDSVTFVGVNIQDQRSKALDLLARTDVGWISVENQDGSLWAELGGLAMPFTVFINAAGEIVDRHNGPLNEALLLERINDTILP